MRTKLRYYYCLCCFLIFCNYSFIVSSQPSVKFVSDIELVCNVVLENSKSWGNKIVRYNPECLPKLRGIGPSVLSTASLLPQYSDLNKTSCYDALLLPLCSIRFEKYESLPGCRETVETFFSIINTCIQTLDPYAANCPTLDRKDSRLIGDPQTFCSEANFREYQADDPLTGLPTSFTVTKFRPGELQDCQHIVMVYNACVQIGRTSLGFPFQYCTSLSFPPYCRQSVSVETDERSRLMCENVVVPALVEFHSLHHRHAAVDFCESLYKKSMTYLAARKGTSYMRLRQMYEALQFTAKPLKIINQLKGPLLRSKVMDNQFVNLLKRSRDIINHMSMKGVVSFPPSLVNEFTELEKAIRDVGTLVLALHVPPPLNDEKIVAEAYTLNQQLEQVLSLQRRALQQEGHFFLNLQNNKADRFTQPLQSHHSHHSMGRITALEGHLLTTAQALDNFRKQYNDRLNLWPINVMSRDQDYIYEGIRQSRKIDLLNMQMKLLISLYFKTNAETFVKNLREKST